MKTSYRGFEIETKREQCLAGYSLSYYSICRQSDGWGMACDYSEGNDTVRSMVGHLKRWVDDYYENPGEYEDEENGVYAGINR